MATPKRKRAPRPADQTKVAFAEFDYLLAIVGGDEAYAANFEDFMCGCLFDRLAWREWPADKLRRLLAVLVELAPADQLPVIHSAIRIERVMVEGTRAVCDAKEHKRFTQLIEALM